MVLITPKTAATIPKAGRPSAVQGRRENFKAVTDGPTIETGQYCRVTGVHGEDTLLVERA